MSQYSYELSLPQWSKKREQILKRDKYRCTCCGSKEGLCVHHTFYYKHLIPPWDYPNKSLLTLCYYCHQTYHETHEIAIKDNPPVYYKNPRNKHKKDKGEFKGIRYPRNLSLRGKVEFKEKWLKKKNNYKGIDLNPPK
jgi:hypothetical protein